MAADQDFNLNVEMETLFSKSGSDYHDLDVKLEDDEEDELGPIVDTPFRARCYTWPRQYLQQQQGQATSPSFRNSCFLIFIVVTFKKKNWRSTIFLSIGVLRRVKIYYYIRYGVYYIVLSADIFLDFWALLCKWVNELPDDRLER